MQTSVVYHRNSFRLVSLQRHRSGMLTMANAVCLMLSALLVVFTINAGHVQNRKIQRQNAADAVVQSAGVWMARGMNSITATNHLMGEMLSLVILHEAVGGKKQEEGKSADEGRNESKKASNPRDLISRDRELKGWYTAASAIASPSSSTYQLVYDRNGNTKILAEATLLDSKMNLKQWLIRVYQGLLLAEALKKFKFTAPAGIALEIMMKALEKKIDQEYRALNALHSITRQLIPLKKLLRDNMLPAAKRYTTQVKQLTPSIARSAAIRVGELNRVEAEVFPTPGKLKLPLQMDPLAILHALPTINSEVPEPRRANCPCPSEKTAVTWDQISKMTQLARASFPWVNYHRKPILDAMNLTLTLADSKELYFHWTNAYSKMIVQEQQNPRGNDPDSHLGLYVLEGHEGPDKGYELWNLAKYSTMADDLFTVLAVAHQPAPYVIGKPIFQQQHSDGMLAWSMALLHNANDQQRAQHRINPRCKRIVPIRQANVGMDTLNWHPGSAQTENNCETRPRGSSRGEFRPFELLGIGLPAEYPRIQVNWQSKLVPATSYRIDQLKRAGLPAPFEPLLNRVPRNLSPTLTTH